MGDVSLMGNRMGNDGPSGAEGLADEYLNTDVELI